MDTLGLIAISLNSIVFVGSGMMLLNNLDHGKDIHGELVWMMISALAIVSVFAF